MLRTLRISGWLVAVVLVACACAKDSPSSPSTTPGAPPGLPTTLNSGCFGWPDTEFCAANHATLQTFLAPGSLAIDFTLKDVDGNPRRLSTLLASRPVLLVHGAWT